LLDIRYEIMLEDFSRRHDVKRPWFLLLKIISLFVITLAIVIVALYIINSNIIKELLEFIQPIKWYIIGGLIAIMIVALGKTQDKVIFNKNQIEKYEKVIEQYKSVSDDIFSNITLIFYPIITQYIVNGQIIKNEIPVYFWEDFHQLHFYEQPPLHINYHQPIHIIIPIESIQYFDYDKKDGNKTILVAKDIDNHVISLMFDHYFYSELYGLIPEKSLEVIEKNRLSNVRAFNHVKSKIALSSQIERLQTLLEKGEISQNEYQKQKDKLLEEAL